MKRRPNLASSCLTAPRKMGQIVICIKCKKMEKINMGIFENLLKNNSNIRQKQQIENVKYGKTNIYKCNSIDRKRFQY